MLRFQKSSVGLALTEWGFKASFLLRETALSQR